MQTLERRLMHGRREGTTAFCKKFIFIEAPMSHTSCQLAWGITIAAGAHKGDCSQDRDNVLKNTHICEVNLPPLLESSCVGKCLSPLNPCSTKVGWQLPGGSLSNTLEHFELDPASSKVHSKGLLASSEWDEEQQRFPTPSVQLFPTKGICSHGKMLTRCCRLYCSICTYGSPCLRARHPGLSWTSAWGFPHSSP